MLAVDYRFVSKEYRAASGVEEVRFSVEAGSFFGILGPSQSGKTTLVRLLFDFIHPSSGEVLVFDRDSRKDNVFIRRSTGYVPARVTGHSRMTVRQMLNAFWKGTGKPDETRFQELCGLLRLEPDARFDTLEDGERKKTAILSALLLDPPLIVLDEPSQDLEPYERELVFSELRKLHEKGSTILITTRSVDEAARHCTHAAILQNGELLQAGEVAQMDFLRARRVTLSADDASGAARALGIANFHGDENTVSFTYSGSADTLVKTLAEFTVNSLRIEDPTMESVLIATRVTEGGRAHVPTV